MLPLLALFKSPFANLCLPVAFTSPEAEESFPPPVDPPASLEASSASLSSLAVFGPRAESDPEKPVAEAVASETPDRCSDALSSRLFA